MTEEEAAGLGALFAVAEERPGGRRCRGRL